jgi:hypothetical protein
VEAWQALQSLHLARSPLLQPFEHSITFVLSAPLFGSLLLKSTVPAGPFGASQSLGASDSLTAETFGALQSLGASDSPTTETSGAQGLLLYIGIAAFVLVIAVTVVLAICMRRQYVWQSTYQEYSTSEKTDTAQFMTNLHEEVSVVNLMDEEVLDVDLSTDNISMDAPDLEYACPK